MSFKGTNYSKDPETGYLTVNEGCRGITSQQKKEFIETFCKTANFGKSAKMVGMDAHTIRDHFKVDPLFHKAYRDSIELLCDEREESIFAMGKHNIAAAFGFLKAYRPGVWNERRIIESKNEETTKLKSLLDLLDKEKKDGNLIEAKEIQEEP